MTKESERLIAYGFRKKDKISFTYGKGNKKELSLDKKKPQEILKGISEIRGSLNEDDQKKFSKYLEEEIADHHIIEYASDQMIVSDYPKTNNMYMVDLESWHESVEKYYYWSINFLGDLGFPFIDKVADVFTAAEHSSFYGAAGQRLGLAQDKVSSYLAAIGKMVKDLFQLVRELRWIDERLEIYRGAIGVDKDGNKKVPEKGAEVALKGMWVDLVDGVVGGQRTGSNLFSMAQQLNFTALPDLFFSIHPQNNENDNVSKVVETEAKDFNDQVKNALKRKLVSYLAWRKATFDEIKNRRTFTLGYLRHHYHVIKMYMNWIRPYVKRIERLTPDTDLLKNPRLVGAFESSLVELEVLARKREKNDQNNYVCLLIKFEYHTKPQMQYTADGGYNRGPIHVGVTRITWRSYSWTNEQVDNFLKMKDQEDLEILSSIDKSLSIAMENLRNDITNYLDEAEKNEAKKVEEKKEEKKKFDLFEPFTAVIKGTIDTFKELVPELPKSKKNEEKGKSGKYAGLAKIMCFTHYNVFKKAHRLLSW